MHEMSKILKKSVCVCVCVCVDGGGRRGQQDQSDLFHLFLTVHIYFQNMQMLFLFESLAKPMSAGRCFIKLVCCVLICYLIFCIFRICGHSGIFACVCMCWHFAHFGIFALLAYLQFWHFWHVWLFFGFLFLFLYVCIFHFGMFGISVCFACFSEDFPWFS